MLALRAHNLVRPRLGSHAPSLGWLLPPENVTEVTANAEVKDQIPELKAKPLRMQHINRFSPLTSNLKPLI